MKYNEETSMDLRLQVEIQELLASITKRCGKQDIVGEVSKLAGICTAIHAYTGEIWQPCWDAQLRYVLMNEDETECITPDEL